MCFSIHSRKSFIRTISQYVFSKSNTPIYRSLSSANNLPNEQYESIGYSDSAHVATMMVQTVIPVKHINLMYTRGFQYFTLVAASSHPSRPSYTCGHAACHHCTAHHALPLPHQNSYYLSRKTHISYLQISITI